MRVLITEDRYKGVKNTPAITTHDRTQSHCHWITTVWLWKGIILDTTAFIDFKVTLGAWKCDSFGMVWGGALGSLPQDVPVFSDAAGKQESSNPACATQDPPFETSCWVASCLLQNQTSCLPKWRHSTFICARVVCNWPDTKAPEVCQVSTPRFACKVCVCLKGRQRTQAQGWKGGSLVNS